MEYLLRRHRSGRIAQISGYVEECYSLDSNRVRTEYRSLIVSAPTRTQPYIVDHDISGRSTESNRLEELLAHSMFVKQTVLLVPNWPPLQVVDFQTPLKAKKGNKHGKIDLLAAGDGLCVVELKVLRKNDTADTPLNALLEAVGYCAVVEANKNRIVDELTATGHRVSSNDLYALVLAPDDYWARWDRRDEAWRGGLLHCADVIGAATGLRVEYGSFDAPEVGASLVVIDPTA